MTAIPPPAPVVSAPAVTARGPSRLRGVRLGALGASAALAVGAFLPWAVAGPFEKAGVDDGSDGVITLILALASAAVVLLSGRSRRLWPWITVLVLAVLAVLVCIVDVADVSGTEAPLFRVSVGGGLWLSLAASVALSGLAVAGMARRRADQPAS
ncbi:MAG: hypothetical protein IT200_14605 [Thermoleophilia bacterium]|nr:hypothetical protein [Thermoleophilia bacterium]